MIELSGGTPKVEGKIKTLAMELGPNFMTDIVEVETSDHAKLSLQLCYNWHFDVDHNDHESVSKLFQVQDFVGNCCKNIASRVRGNVSSVAFEEFQKDSDEIIKKAVFGIDRNDPDGGLRKEVHFKANNLKVTSVDVKSSQPIDDEVRRNLEKSIAVSMDMTTQANEAKARHKAQEAAQRNKGKLECRRLEDKNSAEQARQQLLK